MKTVYPSKISLLLLAIMALFLLVGPVLVGFQEGGLKVLIVCASLFLAYLALIYSICYEVNDTQLIVSVLWVFREVIDISSIKSITSSHSILSAPAASLDRLRISYGRGDEVIISPRRKEEFIRHLQSINPQITFIA